MNAKKAKVKIITQIVISKISKKNMMTVLRKNLNRDLINVLRDRQCGLSIPKMCASPLGYKVAEQFDLHLWPTSAGLVPFTLQPHDKKNSKPLPAFRWNVWSAMNVRSLKKTSCSPTAASAARPSCKFLLTGNRAKQ